MSDKDWYTSHGVQFENNKNQSQPIHPAEQPITNHSTLNVQPKSQVTASKGNSYGEKSLAGLTLIIITLSVQLFFLLISTLPSSGGGSYTVKDYETLITIQLWFSIIVISVQLIGIKLIYNDVRNLSDFLDHDVEVRNNNLNVMARMINNNK